MCILVIVTVTVLESFPIIIHHRSNIDFRNPFSLSVLNLFNVFVYLYLVVNLFNKLDFR